MSLSKTSKKTSKTKQPTSKPPETTSKRTPSKTTSKPPRAPPIHRDKRLYEQVLGEDDDDINLESLLEIVDGINDMMGQRKYNLYSLNRHYSPNYKPAEQLSR